MSVLASSIISRVRTQLIDNGSTYRWTDTELLQWLSDGQRTIVAAVPAAAPKVVTKSLVAGTRQSIPSDGYMLLKVYRNLPAGGAAGAPCQMIDRDVLDRQNQTWHSTTPTSAVKVWMYDTIDPAGFYVYPPNDGTGSVEILYSYMPPDIASLTSTLDVRDIYQTPLFDYVMYRAHSKDSDFAAGLGLATSYMQSFTAFMAAQQGSVK